MNIIHINPTEQDMPDLAHHTTEVAAGIASKTSIGTGVGAVIVGGIGLQDWLIVFGILTTIGTFIINWYYQHKRTNAMIKAKTPCPPNASCSFPDRRSVDVHVDLDRRER